MRARGGAVVKWREEFGEAYAVPAEITSDARLVDVSWRNDVCPSFIAAEDLDAWDSESVTLRLWVEHPDPEQRAWEGPRYVVTREDDNDVHRGDDAAAAVDALLNASTTCRNCGRRGHDECDGNGVES